SRPPRPLARFRRLVRQPRHPLRSRGPPNQGFAAHEEAPAAPRRALPEESRPEERRRREVADRREQQVARTETAGPSGVGGLQPEPQPGERARRREEQTGASR